MKKSIPDVYVIRTGERAERLYGPFKTVTAAVEWALRAIPLAGWSMARVTAP